MFSSYQLELMLFHEISNSLVSVCIFTYELELSITDGNMNYLLKENIWKLIQAYSTVSLNDPNYVF